MVVAYAVYTMRIPYNQMINAAGHYKQTQNSAIMEMLINLISSILLVIKFDIIGVAIGTLLAMVYRMIYFVIYISQNIIYIKSAYFLKMCFVDGISLIVILIETRFMTFEADNFAQWIVSSIFFGIIYAITVLIINVFFNRREFIMSCKMIMNKNV